MKKAILFDRDGVVNWRIYKTYIDSTECFRIFPDFCNFFQNIKNNGYLAVLVTNQQGIGKGVMTEEDLERVHAQMQQELLEKTGYAFDDIFVCTDTTESNSFRRKPNPGMLLEAIEKWDIDINSSFMIGDRRPDILAGKSAGLFSILVGCNINEECQPDLHCRDFYELTKEFQKKGLLPDTIL